jgi:large repetitive protein
MHTLIVFQLGLLSNCMAWPGFTAVFGILGGSKSSSPIFILPPGSSSQPQDNPTSSDNTDLVLDPDSFEIPVTPNPGSPELIVTSRTGNIVSESGTSGSATLRLSQRPNQNVRIHNFNLSLAGEVSVTPHEIIFTPENWDTNQTLTFTGIPDSIQDGDKEVAIQLGDMESLDNRFQGVDAGNIYVLNTDIDSVGIALYPLTGLQTSEDGQSDQLTAVLNSRPTGDVTFTVHISQPGEVSASPASITFSPSNWNTSRVITVTGLNDNIKDGNQPFTLQLVSATSSDPLYNGMESSIAHGTNLDNDTASVVVNTSAPMPYTTSEDGTSVTFRVRLSSQPTHPVTIPVFSLNPLEGQPSTSSLEFHAGNWNVEQNLVVTGINDEDIDGDRSYTIRLDKPVSDDPEYSALHHIDILLTNLDNDTAGLVFTNHLNLTTGEDGTNANFRIRLRSRPTADVTVHLESSDTSEGTISPTTVTFTPGNWNTNLTINIYGVNDSLIDGDIWYEIRFTSVVSSDSNYNSLVINPLPAINLDDDTPGVMYLGASNLVTNENQTGITNFQVRLKTRPTHNVRFPLIQSNNPNEGTISPSELIFTPSNWNVPQNISIQPVRDWIVDADIAYAITFANLESDDPLYSNFFVDAVPVTNRNSDIFGYIFIRLSQV